MERRTFLQRVAIAAMAARWSTARALAQNATASTRTMETDALSIAYEEQGDPGGFPIILLHGFPDDVRATAWRCESPTLGKKPEMLVHDRGVPQLARIGQLLTIQPVQKRAHDLRSARPERCDTDCIGFVVAEQGDHHGVGGCYAAAANGQAIDDLRNDFAVIRSVAGGGGKQCDGIFLVTAPARQHCEHRSGSRGGYRCIRGMRRRIPRQPCSTLRIGGLAGQHQGLSIE